MLLFLPRRSLRPLLAILVATGVPTIVAATSSERAEAAPTHAASPTVTYVPPHIRLDISPAPVGSLWKMTIVNDDSVPLQVVADARLLRFEIAAQPSEGATGKHARDPIVCVLPATMRSSSRTLVLPPSGRYVEAFDPRLYCLDHSRALVADAIVHASIGWESSRGSTKLAAPFEATPVHRDKSALRDGEVATVASAKEIVAAPIVLDEGILTPPAVVVARPMPVASASSSKARASSPPTPRGWLPAHPKPRPAPRPKPAAPAQPHLSAFGGVAESRVSGDDIAFTIEVRNDDDVTVSVYARPQLIGARIRTPRGNIVTCEHRIAPAPIADFVTTLAPHAKWTESIVASEICPAHTFDMPGLYTVKAVLHAPAIPWLVGKKSSFYGDLSSASQQLLRVEIGEMPFHDVAPIALPAEE